MNKNSYKKITLNNGIRVVMEQVKHFSSAAFGILINIGSRHELATENGITHLIEHMHFKGTTSRSYLQISKELDALGGTVNALTEHEYVLFFGKVLHDNLDKLIQLFADIFFNSTFPEEELIKEKCVVIEEIQMRNDTPDELIFDIFLETIFGTSSLAQPIIGRKEIVEKLSRDDIFSFIKKNYLPNRMIIAVAGNIDYAKIEDISNKLFYKEEKKEEKEEEKEKIKTESRLRHIHRDLEQVHIILGTEGLRYGAEERFSLYALNMILGGSMSSRLFQEIRERRGLAYAVSSYIYSFSDCGILGIYTGTSPKNYKEVISIIKEELIKIKEEGVKEEELAIAKNQLRGHFLLALEDTMKRMMRLAEMELYFGRYFSEEEIIKLIEQVSPESVKAVAELLLNKNKLAISSIGNLPNKVYEQITTTLEA